jgi:CRP-like cAMP-binding protein
MQQPPAPTVAATIAANLQDDWGEHGRRLRFLRSVDLLRGCSPAMLNNVATALKPQAVPAGATVCREGEPADLFYLIEAGTLAVLIDVGGEARPIARLGAGQFVGEIALLGGGLRTATVRAETAARLWTLSGAEFEELLRRDPNLSQAVRAAARERERATRMSAFEVEQRNLATLIQDRDRILIGREAKQRDLCERPARAAGRPQGRRRDLGRR